MRRPGALLVVAVAGLLGCVSGFDRNDQIVDSLRILAVGAHVDDTTGLHSDWADADVGDTVHLQALVANPGGLSTVTVTWLACLPIPGQSQPCTDPAYLRDPTTIIPLAQDPSTGVVLLGEGVAIDYTVPTELQPLRDALLARADANVNAECALYMQIPLLVIAQDASSGAVFPAVKNIRLSPWKDQAGNPRYAYYIRNLNPTIQGFNIPASETSCDGQPLATGETFPDGPQTLCLALAPAQSYYTCGLDGPQIDHPDDAPNVPEQPDAIWYMTGGTLSAYPAPTNGSGGSLASRTYTRFTRPAGPFTIYGVVRDHRDGVTWIAQDFQ